MGTDIGMGFSQKLNIQEAALDAAQEARDQIRRDAHINIALVFSTIHYPPHDFLPVVRETLKDIKLVGCSTAGVITQNVISTRGITILLISSDEAHFAVGSVEQSVLRDIRQTDNVLGKHVVREYGQHPRKAFIYFADGLLGDHSLILKGIQDILVNVFPIIGAGSSDDFHFKQTFQFCNDKIMTNTAVGFLMGGQLNIGLGIRHGWKPVGKPRFIDRSRGNIIQTIDGKPAASIYDEYFGDEAQNMRSTWLGQMAILYPLGIHVEGEKEHLLRNAVSIQKDGSIICQGAIPPNSEVHIMIANKESCIQAASDAAYDAQNSLGRKEAKLILVFESMARYKLLGRAAMQEIRAIKDIFGYAIPIVGMYSYGEICPEMSMEDVDKIHLQNESIAILAIG